VLWKWWQVLEVVLEVIFEVVLGGWPKSTSRDRAKACDGLCLVENAGTNIQPPASQIGRRLILYFFVQIDRGCDT
jgi:hypothetical protein